MRKKLAMILTALLLAVGLAIATPATTAQAYPATGTRSVSFTGSSGYKLEINYTLTFDHYAYPYNYYQFQLNLATYTGPSLPGRLADAYVEYDGSSSPSNLHIAGGGAGGPAMFPTNTLVGPSTTRVDGLAGVNWTPFTMRMSTTGKQREPRMRVGVPNASWPETIHYMDLSMPGQMQSGTGQATFTCGDPVDGVPPPAEVSLNYSINVINASQYYVQITYAAITQDNEQGTYYTGIDFDLDSGHEIQSLDPPGGMDTTSRSGTDEWDGDDNFPEVLGTYIYGDGTAPRITLSGETNTGGVYCEKSWALTPQFGVPGQLYANTTTAEFDDCQGGTQPAGEVVIVTTWEQDFNSQLARHVSTTITNNSTAKLVMPQYKPGGFLPQPRYRADDGATAGYVQSTLPAGDARRTWLPGVSRNMDMDPYFWANIANTNPSNYPPGIVVPVDQIPVMDISFDAWKPNGTGWSTCNTSGQLWHLEGTSLRL